MHKARAEFVFVVNPDCSHLQENTLPGPVRYRTRAATPTDTSEAQQLSELDTIRGKHRAVGIVTVLVQYCTIVMYVLCMEYLAIGVGD
jgi:hypothetical protein